MDSYQDGVVIIPKRLGLCIEVPVPGGIVRIWNKRSYNAAAVSAVDCSRPGLYGNPFVVGRDGTRDQCCDKHEAWLETGGSFGCLQASEITRRLVLAHLLELAGNDLLCWCAPERCHCIALAIRANR